jgi:hypothetical protein
VNIGLFEMEEMKILSKNLLELFFTNAVCEAVLLHDGVATVDNLLTQYESARSSKHVGDFLRVFCRSEQLVGCLLRLEVFERLFEQNLNSEFQVQSDSQTTLHEILLCYDRPEHTPVERFL